MKTLLWASGTLAAAVLSLVFSSVLMAAETQDASEWAQQWLEPSRQVNFQGRFVRHNAVQNQTRRYQFWQMDHEGQLQQRMRVEGSTVLEVIRIGDQLSCWHGPDAQVPADHDLPTMPFSDILQADPELLQQNYRLRPLEDARISDRPVDRFRLEPRAAIGLYQHEVWLDRETRLILAHRVFDGDTLLQETRFESVQFDALRMPVSWSSLYPSSFWHRYEARPVQALATGSGTEYADHMPGSFVLEVDESQPGTVYQMWSDGLVRVSLMMDDVDPSQSDAMLNVTERRGAQSLAARAVNGRQWVVAGLIPPQLAEQIVARFE
ncbi:MAG: sigma-E factor regulatory protein RseB domain-containing protein [Saccharospirillum sp.]